MADETVDWNKVWKERHRRVNGIMRTGGCAALWEGEEAARRYSEEVIADRSGRIAKMVGSLNLRPGMRILDIGPGPGAFELLLAPKAKCVTAVEPASGMASVMEENLATRGITNVSILRKRWEDVAESELALPFDLTVSSFSLGMEDLAESLGKMTRVTSGEVNIFWFSAPTPWALFRRELWKDIHGEELPGGNLSDVIVNLLKAKGIPLEEVPLSYGYTDEYSSEDDVLARNRLPFRLETPEQEGRFLELALPRMERASGGYRFSGFVRFSLIRWKGSWQEAS